MVTDSLGASASILLVRACSSARRRSIRRRKFDDIDKHVAAVELAPRESKSLGPFWFDAPNTLLVKNQPVQRGITRKETLQLEALLRTGVVTDEFLNTVLVPLNDEMSEVPRLRAFNWAVTNYAKGHPTLTTSKKENGGGGMLVDLAVSYAQHLKSLHRTLFDPYRRGTLLFFTTKRSTTEYTTVGQLTFVSWCIKNGVDAYVANNEAAIRSHMKEALQGKRKQDTLQSILLTGKKKTRSRELTAAPSKYFRGAMAGDIRYQAGASAPEKKI
jgi:hypothetical protein